MVGIKSVCLIFPGDAVRDGVPDAGLAAADLEAVAIPSRGGTLIRVPSAHGPGVFDEDRRFVAEEVITIVRVPPSAATPDRGADGPAPAVDTEAVGILSGAASVC